jgi:Rhs element Vgr protein
MNVSPLAGRTDLVSVVVMVDGSAIPDDYQLGSVQGTREVNRIGTARLVLTDGDPSTATFPISEASIFVPGATIEIQAGYHQKVVTIFKGIVTRHGIRVREAGAAQLHITCQESAVKMTIGRKSTVYRNQSDSQVLEALIGTHGLSADVASTSVIYEELVRYYSTDWDFMVVRAEASGSVVLVNDAQVSVKPPALSEACGLIVAYGDALRTADAEIDACDQLSAVRASAWSIDEQSVLSVDAQAPAADQQGNLGAETLAAVLSAGTYELMSPTPLSQSDLQQWADAQLLRSRLARIRGTVTFQGSSRAVPGTTIQLDGLGARFNGNAYIARIVHTLENGNWLTEVGFGLSARGFAELRHDVESAPASGLLPAARGLQIGTVLKIDEDPLALARILVDLPLIDSESNGVWARLGTPYATQNAGVQFMPEIGDEVAVGFLNEDPRFPIVLGSLYSTKHAAPYAPDQPNTNKAIVTRNQLKISLEDVKKIITIATPGGQTIVLNDEESSIGITDSNGNTVKLASGGVSITSRADVTIKADGALTLQGAAGVKIQSNAKVSLEAPQVSAQASATLELKGTASAELSSPARVAIQGGIVMIN